MAKLSNCIFGVLDVNRCHIDVSRSFHGAKIKATKDGYGAVSVRFPMTGMVYTLATKKAGKWHLTSYAADLVQRGLI